MPLELDKNLLTGVVFVEIIRQHPGIKISSAMVETVVSVTEEICKAFPASSEKVEPSPAIAEVHSRHTLFKR